MATIYKVTLSWYDEEAYCDAEECGKDDRYLLDTQNAEMNYFFTDCGEAMDFAHGVAYDRDIYNKVGCPFGVYVYKIELSGHSCYKGYSEDNQHFLASYIDIDKNVKW